ncbi:CoA transferase [Aureibacter tunicatorum]|uniref:Crotonobetainyl-CoA:carnitine CoA-transferase CaiB-like acyl-CoA transferase n=1 Tax=Aureibacter tunicatorum TaxID=866807 RepID=A0AAE3XSC5_9BACT|nr:CoA transferase [Aureibacter tunicatorum]MDR6241095.1 crotonobetainyl-CoA:carnitine CoA-transferase CaiB-like acyl-CoA transferase [Aureibacter tunicatorum]BDD03873.1 carnitine dehydratase [Aureibacter tunicatorum]
MGKFNIKEHFEAFCKEIGMNSHSAGVKSLVFKGEDPVLPDKLRLGAIYAIPAAAQATQIADIWHIRTGRSQDIEVDLAQGAPMISDIPFTTLNGRPYFNQFVTTPNGYNCPFFYKFYPTKDKRLFVPVGFYPHMERAWSEFLNCPATDEAVKNAIKEWNAEELQEACNAIGLVGSYVRTKDEWYNTKLGKELQQVPVVKITKIADGVPIPWTEHPSRPLSGIRVLGDTHEIMAPIITHTLANQGADGLQVSDPNEYWHEFVYMNCLPGVRQAYIDLEDDQDKQTFHNLAMHADVFVENFRTQGKIAQQNFVENKLVPGHRGLIYVKAHGYSYDGMTWNDRGCFDPLAIPCTGVAALEGTLEQPKYSFGNLLNDGISGLCAVPGILEALKRRATEGGSYKVEVSLCKTSMWCMDLGAFEKTPDVSMPHPRMLEINGNVGKMIRPSSAIFYSETEDRWSHGISYRGADKAEWK